MRCGMSKLVSAANAKNGGQLEEARSRLDRPFISIFRGLRGPNLLHLNSVSIFNNNMAALLGHAAHLTGLQVKAEG